MRINTPLKRKPETYTRKQGRYIGFDGFVVPKNFSEYYERYPTYVQLWVHRNIHAPTVRNRDDVLDVATDLHMFLMVLPKHSIRRTRTIKDVIAAFDPAKCEGASKAKFFRFLDFTLWNAFTTIWRKTSRDALQQAHPVILMPDGSEYRDTTCSESDDYDKTLELLQADDSVQHDLEDKIRIDQFKAFIAAELDILKLLEALHQCGSMRKARLALGWTQTYHRYATDRLKVLADCFEAGTPVPERSTWYKARRKSTPMDNPRACGAKPPTS